MLAVIAGVAVALFSFGTRKIVQPLHARGWAPRVTSMVDSVAGVAEAPGREVALRFLPARLDRYRSKAAVPLNMAFWTVMMGAWLALGRVRWPGRGQNSRDTSDAVGMIPSRRRFLGHALQGAAAFGAAGALAYGSVWEPRHLRVVRRTFPLRGLPKELDGLRVVQVSDVHHGPWLSEGDLHRIVRTANALQPDLILLTGDYVLHERVYAEPAVRVLSELRAPIGIVAVLGNHDWHESAPTLRAAFPKVGIPMLDNTRLFVRPDRTLVREADVGLCVAGVGDYWHDRQLYDAALGGLPEAMPRILLSHNPDVAEDHRFLACRHRVDLMISGHTHGGQVKLPGVGALVTYSHYGKKYLHGLAQGPACPVHVSAGVGMSKMPVRIGVPPEIVVFEFTRAG